MAYKFFILTLLLNNLTSIKSFSQDPFFINFYNNESLFNPAMVVYKVAFSFNTKYKSQWNSYNISGFKSQILEAKFW